MRNLKKILALVLALVMSLSLMAVAGATETTSASDAYADAKAVLTGLEVFKGDAGSGDYRFQSEINRTETAALIYRIVTGDTADAQKDIYTQHPFTDVVDNHWGKGYISYCYNAEIIKGTSATTFNPGDPVTGYQTLAMVLRAMGYGKNGEFEGETWHIQTAARAESIGLLKNINQALLGQPATREMVAEILFQALQTETVLYSPLTPGQYTKTGKTLGQEQFGLEKITGVIKANEWANLEGDTVLDDDTTKMTVTSVTPANSAYAKPGETVTLKVESPLEAVGLTYNAYVSGKGSEKKVMTALVKDSINKVVENEKDGQKGLAVASGNSDQGWKSISELAGSLKLDDAKYFENYSESLLDKAQSKYKISYAISDGAVKKHDGTGSEWADYLKGKGATTRVIDVTVDAAGNTSPVTCYYRGISPDEVITTTDIAIMKQIFYTADRLGWNDQNNSSGWVDYRVGEVYVGTTSQKDISDTMAWVDFEAEYLMYDRVSKLTGCGNGDTLRVVDNDGDGKAEYVLKVYYTQSKATDTVDDQLAFNGPLLMKDYSGNKLYNPDNLTKDDLGVVANYVIIDKKLSIYRAEKLDEVISTKNYRDRTVTTTNGITKGQSDIINKTGLDQLINTLNEKVEYYLYLDTCGFIRSFELAQGKQYALLTELYNTNAQNANWVNSVDEIVEMKVKDADVAEYVVANRTTNPFSSSYAWTRFNNQIRNGYQNILESHLQPATAHLGIATSWLAGGWTDALGNVHAGTNVNGAATGFFLNYVDRDNNVAGTSAATWNLQVYGIQKNTSADEPGVFAWQDGSKYVGFAPQNNSGLYAAAVDGTTQSTWKDFSITNVGKYMMDGDKVTLSTASEIYRNPNGYEEYRAVADLTVGTQTVPANKKMTSEDWSKWYAAASGKSDFNTWFRTQLYNGSIYLVYATDYVKLASGNDAGATGVYGDNYRHFRVADDYNRLYRAMSNLYIDTTNETQFYVVTPGSKGIIYKEGFTEFAKVGVQWSRVRAAYAVAQNTSLDANSEDYWVADVVVIEVDELTSGWDSVALMYYNPYETTSNVQFVDALDSEWRGLGTNATDKAKVSVIPTDRTTWNNSAWGDGWYGFYALYDQSVSTPGTIAAGKVVQLGVGDYNNHKIYAGVVRRTTTITSSGYIDVNKAGVNSNDVMASAVTVKFSDWNTPVYRLVRDEWRRTTANEISLTNWDSTNKVESGDYIIYVLDKSGNCEFIVDLGDLTSGKVGTRAYDYYIPSWLVRVYDEIAYEQGPKDYVSTDLAKVKKAAEQIIADYDAYVRDLSPEYVEKVTKDLETLYKNNKWSNKDLEADENGQTAKDKLEILVNAMKALDPDRIKVVYELGKIFDDMNLNTTMWDAVSTMFEEYSDKWDYVIGELLNYVEDDVFHDDSYLENVVWKQYLNKYLYANQEQTVYSSWTTAFAATVNANVEADCASLKNDLIAKAVALGAEFDNTNIDAGDGVDYATEVAPDGTMASFQLELTAGCVVDPVAKTAEVTVEFPEGVEPKPITTADYTVTFEKANPNGRSVTIAWIAKVVFTAAGWDKNVVLGVNSEGKPCLAEPVKLEKSVPNIYFKVTSENADVIVKTADANKPYEILKDTEVKTVTLTAVVGNDTKVVAVDETTGEIAATVTVNGVTVACTVTPVADDKVTITFTGNEKVTGNVAVNVPTKAKTAGNDLL